MQKKRECAHCKRTMRIGGRGLCNTCYMKVRDSYPVQQPNRPFTANERDFIRRHATTMTAKEIAAHLGRKTHSIQDAKFRFGATIKRPHLSDHCVRRRVKGLYRRGYSTGQISRKIGVSVATVGRWIKRLGLPPIGMTKWSRQQQSIARKRIIEEHGAEHLIPMVHRYYLERLEAARMGWPAGCTLYEARILESLYLRGASTNAQIAEDTGIKVGTVKNLTYHLANRGLAVVLYRVDKWNHYGLAYGLRPFSKEAA